MVLWAVMSTILILLTVSTHPSDSVYTLQYQGGTFLVDRSQYQQLADAFLHGRIWIDAHVPDWLAAMDNPYDEQARGTLGMQTGDPSRWDWAFYHGRYYCYFGPLPALLLFAPFKALTGTDLPTAVGCAFLAILACASLIFLIETLWKRYWHGTPRWLAVLVCTAIVAASGLTYLVLVPWFYSIPILASLALAPAGIALWARSSGDGHHTPRTPFIAIVRRLSRSPSPADRRSSSPRYSASSSYGRKSEPAISCPPVPDTPSSPPSRRFCRSSSSAAR